MLKSTHKKILKELKNNNARYKFNLYYAPGGWSYRISLIKSFADLKKAYAAYKIHSESIPKTFDDPYYYLNMTIQNKEKVPLTYNVTKELYDKLKDKV